MGDATIDARLWDRFCDRIRAAGHEVLAAAPDDALDRAEGLRFVSRLTEHALGAFLERSDPAAPVLSTTSPKIGGDNPDYVYGGATISGAHTYLLRGRVNDAARLGIGTYHGGLGTPEGLQCSGYLDSSELALDGDGRFEITLSVTEPAQGDWLVMRPDTNQLTIRQTVLERRRHTPATFELDRTDTGPAPGPLDPAVFAGRLDRAGGFVAGVVHQFLGWTASFAAHPNEIHPIDPALLAVAQGDPGTYYYNGWFELAEHQRLVITLRPPTCDYWNLQLCNHWLESLDFWHHTIHVNHHTAVTEPDGSVNVIVAHRDPGLPNWLDTAGHRRGGIALRWVGAGEATDPVCRVETW